MTPGGRHQSFPFFSGSGDSSFGHSAPAGLSSTRFNAIQFGECITPHRMFSKQRAERVWVDLDALEIVRGGTKFRGRRSVLREAKPMQQAIEFVE